MGSLRWPFSTDGHKTQGTAERAKECLLDQASEGQPVSMGAQAILMLAKAPQVNVDHLDYKSHTHLARAKSPISLAMAFLESASERAVSSQEHAFEREDASGAESAALPALGRR